MIRDRFGSVVCKKTARMVGEISGQRVYLSVDRYDTTYNSQNGAYRGEFLRGPGPILSHFIGTSKLYIGSSLLEFARSEKLDSEREDGRENRYCGREHHGPRIWTASTSTNWTTTHSPSVA
ncbi:hypothetical protein RvY_07318 [Ramazzottius varieornatus]|uniref:Uncharacterized protein n=1 Tax=Ramazzottius varieornatus TaxID=947166 RepID=A0A1D1V6P7_RAMVA|nr:hypothetical protein RvY_07318 [Ramazzottius varieornatus]